MSLKRSLTKLKAIHWPIGFLATFMMTWDPSASRTSDVTSRLISNKLNLKVFWKSDFIDFKIDCITVSKSKTGENKTKNKSFSFYLHYQCSSCSCWRRNPILLLLLHGLQCTLLSTSSKMGCYCHKIPTTKF